MVQLPRYRHYHRYRRCQAITTITLSLLPRYCHHPIASLRHDNTSAVAALPLMTSR
jgi:hypothetical protein